MTLLTKTISSLFIIICIASTPIFAKDDKPVVTTKKITKKISNSAKTKAAAYKAEEPKINNIDDGYPTIDSEADIKLSSQLEFKCELGNSLTLYTQENNDQFLNMRWKNRLYRLNRVNTSTGANRYENEKAGLVWINIPAKGLLLDSIKGRQLANECKSSQTALIS